MHKAKDGILRYIDDVFIFSLLMISSGFQISTLSGRTRLLYYLLIVVLMIVIKIKKIKRSIPVLYSLLAVFIILLMSTTVIMNNESTEQLAINTALVLTAASYGYLIGFSSFCNRYVSVIKFISLYSLVLYIIALVYPSLVRLLPTVQNSVGHLAYNAFFSQIRLDFNPLRNQGLFWEPGAFQTFICIALMIVLFGNMKYKFGTSLILTITLISTLSTAGYISGGFIFLVYIVKKIWDFSRKKTIDIKRMQTGLLLVFIVFLFLYRYQTFLYYNVFLKLTTFFVYDQLTTASVRFQATIYPIKLFLSSPLIGVGVENTFAYANLLGYQMNTNTSINWFAMYGFIFGFLMLIGIYLFLHKICNSKWLSMFLLVAFLLALFSEDFTRNPSVLVFAFLGFTTISTSNGGGKHYVR